MSVKKQLQVPDSYARPAGWARFFDIHRTHGLRRGLISHPHLTSRSHGIRRGLIPHLASRIAHRVRITSASQKLRGLAEAYPLHFSFPNQHCSQDVFLQTLESDRSILENMPHLLQSERVDLQR